MLYTTFNFKKKDKQLNERNVERKYFLLSSMMSAQSPEYKHTSG